MLVDQHMLRPKFSWMSITVRPLIIVILLSAYIGESHECHESKYLIPYDSKDNELISLQFPLGRNLWTCSWHSEGQFLSLLWYRPNERPTWL